VTLAVLLVALSLGGGVQAAEPKPGTVAGVVHDPTGAVVVGASVTLRDGSREQRTSTGGDGHFSFNQPPSAASKVVVRAPGFAEAVVPADGPELDVRLTPATLVSAVTVTATRTAASDQPAATNVLTGAELQNAPAPMLDDQLKVVPGFSLFRRTTSRAANPTTQGVTMRGLSASGASRSLVLVDGVPLNDPFGGWVYWDRIPQAALDRVEVVRGGTSDLYGADAVGGVIQVLTLAPSRPTVRAAADYASRATPRLSLFGGGGSGGWTAFGAGEWQRSDGYIIVAPDVRGPIDTPASADYRTAYGSVAYQTGGWRASIRGNLFHEERQNGTPLTPNSTSSRSVAGELTGNAAGGVWLVRGYGGTQGYDQGFSAVNASRTAETLTTLQHVPSSNAGGTAQWTTARGRATWTFGTDVRRIAGQSDERAFNNRGIQTGSTDFGGLEWTVGGFGRLAFAIDDRLTLDGSVNVDRWSADPNQSTNRALDKVAFNPKVGATWRMNDDMNVFGAVTQAFRAPTLNELYRNFRVGGTLTLANSALQPEVLTGVEGGAAFTKHGSELRIVAFFNNLSDAVTNLTRVTTPSLITRQRGNAGTIHAAGVELEGEWQVAPGVRAFAGVELVSSTFADSQEPGLAGNRVPQVARVQGNGGLRITAPAGVSALLLIRGTSSQFDDDRNQFLLRSAGIVDLSASKAFHGGVELFGAVENLFNDQYDVGRTPLLTIGLPRTVRIGLRYYLP